MLYAILHDATTSVLPVGRIVVCRFRDGDLREASRLQHGRRFLLSAHPRYRPIAIEDAVLEIIGLVIGKVGRIT